MSHRAEFGSFGICLNLIPFWRFNLPKETSYFYSKYATLRRRHRRIDASALRLLSHEFIASRSAPGLGVIRMQMRRLPFEMLH